MKFSEFQFWTGKACSRLSAGAAMTLWNFLRTASTEPRMPIDAAAFAPVEPFALSLILL